ncbi:hypothetical protein E1265_26570 [Streptomyces sp. 8K308]|uniref:hypothetical protein n=1 Tax=Streptomyces sp. 8K308 TaxID=2530388 RepID=UPI001045E85B|nr:hypothetical protein [Streptomyces sp. 8K308]TDC15540.1 hypothetical protein E1265_26570 [Streptomyces sp. 8K308]
MVAIRNKDSYLGVFYRRLAGRRGGRRAIVAVMHKFAIAIWHVLHDKVPYRELGADHFTRRAPERAMRRVIKEANSLGRPSASTRSTRLTNPPRSFEPPQSP